MKTKHFLPRIPQYPRTRSRAAYLFSAERERVMVSCEGDLDQLLEFRRVFAQPSLLVISANISREDVRRWERRINLIASDCGCVHAAFSFLTAVAVCLLLHVKLYWSWVPTLWQSACLCMFAAVFGKLVGLSLRALAYQQTLRVLRSELSMINLSKSGT